MEPQSPTIQMTRDAIRLVITGAISAIEREFADHPPEHVVACIRDLIDQAVLELSMWETPGTMIDRVEEMVGDMHVLLDHPEHGKVIRNLLVSNGLLDHPEPLPAQEE